MNADDLAPIWKALADPTRRRIIDLLCERPMTTGQLAGEFPVSRIAVMKHLAALGEAGLVLARKRGRERWHYLNYVPLQRVHERWFEPQAGRWASSFIALKRHVETKEARREMTSAADWPLSLDIEQEVALDAPRTRVFAALIEETGAWWGHPYLNDETTALILEPALGGRFYEVWGEDAGALLATVSAIAPNRRLGLTGRLHVGVGIAVADFRLEDDGKGTVLKFSLRAIGHVSPEAAERFAGGWAELLTVRLKAFVERGERLGLEQGAKE